MDSIYYHNPKCSKSRAGLELLQSKNIKVIVKEYLKEKLEFDEIKNILNALEIKPLDIIRKKESTFTDLQLDRKNYTESEYIEFIQKHPILLERPILLMGDRAAIGRPIEKLEALLKK